MSGSTRLRRVFCGGTVLLIAAAILSLMQRRAGGNIPPTPDTVRDTSPEPQSAGERFPR